MPRLTVMMPAKDASQHIETAITSTLRAMPRDSELVVWDDGSTDGTAHIASSIPDRRLRVERSSSTSGGGATRAKILASSDSEFVAAMDADDVCLPWRFRRQARMVRGGVEVAFTASIRFGPAHRMPRPSSFIPVTGPAVGAALVFLNPFVHPSLYARRDVLAGAGGYSALETAQDYEFWIRLHLNGARIVSTAVPGVLYRLHGRQVSASAGYLERIRSQPGFMATYRSLLRQEAPRAEALIDESGRVPIDQHPQFVEALLAEAARLPPALRWRISRSMSSRAELLSPSAYASPLTAGGAA